MKAQRRKGIILLACGILVLAALWQLVRDREPSYQGRRLSQWVDQWQQSTYNDAEAQGAISAIGTNAIPTSLDWMSYEASPLRNKLADLVIRLSPGLRRGILSPEQRAYDAMDVFAILGPQARAAIPELTRLAQTASDPERASRCIQVLSRLGPEALPRILTFATNGPPHTRGAAISMLPSLGTNTVPILIQLLDDKDSSIADAIALYTLACLGTNGYTVMPSLNRAMRSFSTQARLRAVKGIMLLHSQSPAHKSVPVLHPLLNDPEYEVRNAATNALLSIAPEVLTNAPPE